MHVAALSQLKANFEILQEWEAASKLALQQAIRGSACLCKALLLLQAVSFSTH